VNGEWCARALCGVLTLVILILLILLFILILILILVFVFLSEFSVKVYIRPTQNPRGL
jgi:uncharacterized membrane protein